MLSSMTTEELVEAKAEAEARLPAAAVEFLRRRGWDKQQHREQREEKASSCSTAAAAAVAPPSLEALDLNSTGAPCFPPRSLLEKKATRKKKKEEEKNEAAPAAANQTPPPPAAPSSLLRFDFDSACPVLPLAGPDERPSDSLLRDPLRSEKKELGEENAYTLAEAAALARSAMPAQRLAAVDLLSRVISKLMLLTEPEKSARVFSAAVGDDEAAAAAAVAAAAAAADDSTVTTTTSSSSPPPPPPPPPPPHLSITWGQVRLGLIRTAPLVLRNALDDGHPPVVAAAAAGLALLVDEGGVEGGDENEDEKTSSSSFAAALAAASIYPLTGSPALASAPATRPHAVGAWVRQGVVNDYDDEDDDDDQEEQDGTSSSLAATASPDPVAGLLQTAGFLEKVSAILAARSSHRAYGAATLPLIKLLRAAAAAGGEAAAAAAGSRSAVAALFDVACFGEGGGEEREASAAKGENEDASTSWSSSFSSWSSIRARAAAFDTISLLCAATGESGATRSETNASTSTNTIASAPAALAAAGVGGVVSSTLLVSAAALSTPSSCSSPSSSSPSSSPSNREKNALLLASSLRAWRSLMGRGVPCIRLDDAFSTLRFLFDDDDDSGDEEGRDSSSPSSSLYCTASAEALAAAAAAIASREEACCSRGGASAVAAQVLSWATSEEALGRAAAAVADESSSSSASAASAAAFLTRLAAAWRLLAVAEGEKLLESGRLRAAVAAAAAVAGGGEGNDLKPLAEGAARAATAAFFDKSSGLSSSSSSSSSRSSTVAVACCELVAALLGLYRCCCCANLSFPPWLSPRALTSSRSALGKGAVAAAEAAARVSASSSPIASSASATTTTTTTATSWTRADAALHQSRRHALQLMAMVGFEAKEEEEEEQEGNGNSSSSISSVPLTVLHLAPPGTEATIALPALAAFLSASSLAPMLARADEAVEKLAAAAAEKTDPLSVSAGRFGGWERLTTTRDGRGSSCNNEVSAAVKAFSRAALADYAAAWLGMMVKEEEEEGEEKKKESTAAASPLPRPFRLADPAGSRLPLPPWGSSPSSSSSSWILADVCSRGVASAREASEAVGRALTLTLALLKKRSSSSSLSTAFLLPPHCLDLSLLAASVADLLLGGDSGVFRGDSEAWRNPRARWAVAALSEEVRGRGRAREEGEEGGSGKRGSAAAAAASTKITPARATGWASSWASDAFADPLCGGLVAAAALLSHDSGASSSSSSSSYAVAASASAAAVAAFDLLEESDALSSLPPWDAAVFVPPSSCSFSSSSPSRSSFRLPAQLASRAASALAAGRLDRAIEEGGGVSSPSSSPSLVLSDALGWLREQCLVVVRGERRREKGSSDSSAADPVTAAAAAAAAALRHFLAQARPKHVAALVRSCGGGFGEGEGDKIDRIQTLKALRSALGGNEALENKVEEAEKMIS